MGYGRCLSHTF